MSNPYATPTPEDAPMQGSSWSQDPQAAYSAPAQPAYGQPTYGQPAYGQPAYGQPVYGQPAYGQPVGAGYVNVESLKTNATIALVMSILGLVGILPLIGSIVGWVMGARVERELANAGMPSDVVPMAKWAKILGIVGVVLAVLGIVIIILLFILGLVVSLSDPSLYSSAADMTSTLA